MISVITEMVRILRTKEYVGDAAALKLTILYKNDGDSPYLEAVSKMKDRHFSPLSMDELKAKPPGSFGNKYYEFMKKNKLTPLNFSEKVEHIFDDFPVSTRYIRIHDMVHVLLDFDADIPGEIGVYAFINEQNYCKTLKRASQTALLIGQSMSYLGFRSAQKAIERGKQLAQNAKVLIEQPLEDYLDEDLSSVRERMGLAL